MSHKNKLILKYPASWWKNAWREALPSGNGVIGASVYGGVYKETVLLNHGELWEGGQKKQLPDISHTLKKVRRLMDQKKYKKVSFIQTKALLLRLYMPSMAVILPFADLVVTMPNQKGFKNYQRCLDMQTGEVCVTWEDGDISYKRSLFVSRADNVVVYEMSSHNGQFNAEITMEPHSRKDSSKGSRIKKLQRKIEDDFLYYAASNNGSDYGAVLRVHTEEGSVSVQRDCIQVNKVTKVLVLVKLFVKGKREADWKNLKDEINLIRLDYNNLLKAHVDIHGQLFNSASIDLSAEDDSRSNEELLLDAYSGRLPNAMAEKMWAFGRYLLISSSSPSGLPCSLYGLWCGDYKPIWCQHVANENVQMIYSHAAVGGISVLLQALFNHYESILEDSRQNASKIFGCRGINIHGYTTPGNGLVSLPFSIIMNWTGAAGWIARFYYDYYLYTGDMDFLKNRALPFMREAAMFYEDFLVTGEEGYLKSYPSISPENSPGQYWNNNHPLGHPMPTTINATMDFAIVKELLGNLVRIAEITGQCKDEAGKWQEMLKKIPPYQINGEGAVREWMHEDFDDHYSHRHMSHTYPIFPGYEIIKENNPELFGAFAKAVEKRLIVGLKEQSGWSLGHMASLFARMEKGNSALECLELLSRSCVLNSFFTVHNDWRNMGITVEANENAFQVDANMCWTNAVQEMVLYSSPEMVKILPACPEKWKKGSVKGLHFCTGRVSFDWDMVKGCFSCEICSERNTHTTLRLPKQFSNYKMVYAGGDAVTQMSEGYYQIRLECGSKLYISAEPGQSLRK